MTNRLDNDGRYGELFRLIEEEKRQREQTQRDLNEFKDDVREEYVTKESVQYLFGWVNSVKGWIAALIGAGLLAAILRLILK